MGRSASSSDISLLMTTVSALTEHPVFTAPSTCWGLGGQLCDLYLNKLINITPFSQALVLIKTINEENVPQILLEETGNEARGKMKVWPKDVCSVWPLFLLTWAIRDISCQFIFHRQYLSSFCTSYDLWFASVSAALYFSSFSVFFKIFFVVIRMFWISRIPLISKVDSFEISNIGGPL